MKKPRLATLWLDGCSGCHMSLLDLDAELLTLAEKIELVYSPLLDVKIFPEEVDITCIEGAVSSKEDEARLRSIRARSRLVIALGDCAVTGNIPALRNGLGADAMLKTVYLEHGALNHLIPNQDLPTLNRQALPLHAFIQVDLFLPGCPPAASVLGAALGSLIEGQPPIASPATWFGA